MANHLDLEEQEQLDQLKHFWKQFGNAISWALILVLGVFASWNFYQYWQRGQSVQAAAMFDEVSRVVAVADSEKIDRAFSDMKDRFPTSTYAQQAGLLVAKHYYALSKVDSAKAALSWVADKSSDSGYQSIAKLRLAGVLMDGKLYDEALKLLNESFPANFSGLVGDRRGDIFLLQGKTKDAIAEFETALKSFDERSEYRRLVEVKLNSLGVDPNTRANARIAAVAPEGKK